MPKISAKDVIVPFDVPTTNRDVYIRNYLQATKETGRLMLFAGDQKVEHLNNDFYGKGIHEDDASPEHLFRIAQKARIGLFAAQVGLICRYASNYPEIQYLAKINSKSDLVKSDQMDPLSTRWLGVDKVIEVRKNGVNIIAVGFTVYLGSEYEAQMLREAAEVVFEAHKNGLVTVLWLYPRGKAVKDEKDPHLIAGAAGVASCLGTDFVKVNQPKREGFHPAELLKEAVLAAGRTGVVCAGGGSVDPKTFLQQLYDQIHVGGCIGNATGRNIHQKPLKDAVNFCNALYAITIEDKGVDEAYRIYQG